ncbi:MULTISPECIES: thioesterase family protein [Citrifermentans]|uniref:Acyl-CoA thioesterase n=1 Tax=Citrifermentans bemidjiense (strain ATCC BAA-1014 / DSM 16622 / JCM 12645 / Bem) TaxID=404380 RepID=B5EG61_CITBB|nr:MULTISPECIES: thioesterase family protein [Citrifermentans]ACH40974.1 acyl-CoA thioesterase [Citrifermentans bemidjiense Bem]
MKELQVGLKHTFSYLVPKERTVPFLYPESSYFQVMPEVFATGYMVGFMEWACMDALAPYLDEGERTVGTMINVTHEAATPAGMEVTATVTLVEVDGKRTVWEIEARDEVEVIGRGRHERFVIDYEKFSKRVAAKGNK